MNAKIVGAFISGAVLASGIVYMAIRPNPSRQPVPITELRTSEIPSPPAPTSPVARENPAPIEPPAAAPAAKPAIVHTPKPVQQRARLAQTPIREKPSPMPPARHSDPVVLVRNEEPKIEVSVAIPQQPTPEPPPVAAPPAPEPAPLAIEPIVAKTVPPPAPDAPQPHSVVLAAGTRLTVRIGETISAGRNQIGDTFVATLEQPLVIDGFIICERGSRVIGKVTQATPAGRAGGQSHLSIELTRLNTSDRQRVDIRTETYSKDGSGGTGSDLAKIGAGTAIGAAIGAIAGGGKGAAIGAGAGAAAGTGVVLVSNGRSVEVPVEARVTFRVKEPVTITEKLD
jgi:hypothetical protein